MDKKHLRQTYSTLRQHLSYEEVLLTSQKVAENFLMNVHASPMRILSYAPLRKYNEIDPACIEKQFPKATIAILPHRKGISTPNDGKFDLIIVPMIAGDRQCHRLGFGGGWYDQFLATQASATKIGLCYDQCIVEALPHEPHDVALSAIVTDIQFITS